MGETHGEDLRGAFLLWVGAEHQGNPLILADLWIENRI